MLKEYIIRIDDLRHDKKIARKLKAICKEFEGEFYTKTIDDKYNMGRLKLTPRQEHEGLRR